MLGTCHYLAGGGGSQFFSLLSGGGSQSFSRVFRGGS